MALVTVVCTAKIYSTLKTIRAWNTPLTVPVYLAFALATGGCLLAASPRSSETFRPSSSTSPRAFSLIAIAVKLAYWHRIDTAPA